jgi:hypothetical protein
MNKDFITITKGLRGWFAVHMWWNKELDGFWEPWQSGIGSFENKADAIKEGKQWADAEGLDFSENMP